MLGPGGHFSIFLSTVLSTKRATATTARRHFQTRGHHMGIWINRLRCLSLTGSVSGTASFRGTYDKILSWVTDVTATLAAQCNCFTIMGSISVEVPACYGCYGLGWIRQDSVKPSPTMQLLIWNRSSSATVCLDHRISSGDHRAAYVETCPSRGLQKLYAWLSYYQYHPR